MPRSVTSDTSSEFSSTGLSSVGSTLTPASGQLRLYSYRISDLAAVYLAELVQARDQQDDRRRTREDPLSLIGYCRVFMALSCV